MPNNFKELFIELFSKQMSMSSYFQGYNENTKSFVFKKEGDEIILNLLWNETNNKIFPIFKSIGKIRLYNHIYSNQELCHNFVVVPLETEETINIEVPKYVSSIGKYIYSLKRESRGFVSNLPENDLTDFENMMAFGYKTAISSSGFFIGDILKVSISSGSILSPRLLIFKKDIELLNIEINIFSREKYIVKDVQKNLIFIKLLSDKENKEVGELMKINIYNRTYPFELNQDKNVLLVGLGSLGSFVFQNILNWSRIKSFAVNDPDIFLPKNYARSNFVNVPWLLSKSNIAIGAFNLFKPNYIDFKIDFKSYNFLIGARTSSSRHGTILKLLQGVDIIIDATGSDAVFKELATLKNNNTIIYKMSLYASGNGMIMGSFVNGDANEFAGKWSDLRIKKEWDIASAYNGKVPAGFLETSIAANHLTKFIYDTCDKPTTCLKEIDNV